VGFGLAQVIGTISQFEFEMARVRAITGATDLEFEALTNTARELGATTIFTASQAAEGLRLLAQAGFSTREALEAIKGTLDLAIAGAVDLGTATDITSNIIRGFQLDASEAGRVADVLATTVNSANTNMFDLGSALKFVAPAAKGAGISLEETAGAIGTLSDAGLKGTLAGTGLRRVIIGLINQSQEGERVLRKLGITMEDLNFRVGGLEPVFEKLRQANVGVSEAFKLFGQRGGGAALVMLRLGERMRELTGRANESEGAAAAVAEILGGTLRVRMLALKSAIEELILGQNALAKGFGRVVDFLTGTARALGGMLNPMDANAARFEAAAETVKNFSAVFGLLGDVLGPVIKAIGAVVVGLGKMIRFVRDSDNAIAKFLRGALLPLKLALEGIGILSDSIIERAGGFNDAFAQASTALNNFNEDLEKTSLLFDKIQSQELRGEDLIVIGSEIEKRIERTTGNINRLETEYENLLDTWSQTGQDRLLDRAEEIEEALRLAKGQLAGLNALAAESKFAEDLQTRFASAGAAFQSEIVRIGEIVSSATKDAANNLAKSLLDQKFEIEQLRLGVGAEADLQRDIRAALRTAGLESERALAEPFIQAQEAIAKEIQKIEEERDAIEDITKEERKLFQDRLDFQKLQLANINEIIDERRRQRESVIRLTTEQSVLNKAQKEEEERRKRAERQTLRAERFRDQMNVILASLNAERQALDKVDREREIDVMRRRLQARAARQGVKDVDDFIERIIAEKRALQELERTDVAAASRRAVKQFADDAGDVAGQVEDLIGGTFERLEDELLAFIETGKFNFRDFGMTILRELARIQLKKQLAGILDFAGATGEGKKAGDFGGLARSFGFGGIMDLFKPEGAEGVAGGPQPGEADIQAATATVNAGSVTVAGALAGGAAATPPTQGELLIAQNVMSGASGTISEISEGAAASESGFGSLLGVLGSGFQSLKGSLSSLLGAIQGLFSGGGGGGGGGGGSTASTVISGVQVAADILSMFAAEGGMAGRSPKKGSVPAAMFTNAQRFQTGGVTGDTIPALLSPNEAVIPLSRNRKVPVEMKEAARPINVNFNITTPDAESFGRSRDQILSQAAGALRRAATRDS
jgi:TP901 family phage tail tape measure protein/lambda family phage tail tape measure protein